MPDPDHPPWCATAYCTIGRPPLAGHRTGAHRSVPRAIDATVLRIRQVPDGDPMLQIQRGNVRLALPLAEAHELPPELDALLEAAGLLP